MHEVSLALNALACFGWVVAGALTFWQWRRKPQIQIAVEAARARAELAQARREFQREVDRAARRATYEAEDANEPADDQPTLDLLGASGDPDAAQASADIAAGLDSLFRALGPPPDPTTAGNPSLIPTQGGGVQS